jgi:hypothetical protein
MPTEHELKTKRYSCSSILFTTGGVWSACAFGAWLESVLPANEGVAPYLAKKLRKYNMVKQNEETSMNNDILREKTQSVCVPVDNMTSQNEAVPHRNFQVTIPHFALRRAWLHLPPEVPTHRSRSFAFVGPTDADHCETERNRCIRLSELHVKNMKCHQY